MSEEPKYKVTLDGLTFYATLHNDKKGYKFLRLGILPSGGACVEVQIVSGKKFTLLGVLFDSRCVRTKDMKRGGDTRVMVNATLQLLKTLYPKCKILTVDDTSHFYCNSVKDDISLPTYNILLYGKTWYQRYFNAKFGEIDEKSLKNLEDTLKKLQMRPSLDSIYSSWHKYFQSLTCAQYYRVEEKYRKLLDIPRFHGTNWIIDEFPENKSFTLERDDSIDLQSGGFRRMIL